MPQDTDNNVRFLVAGWRAAIRVREPYLRRRRGAIWTREAVG